MEAGNQGGDDCLELCRTLERGVRSERLQDLSGSRQAGRKA